MGVSKKWAILFIFGEPLTQKYRGKPVTRYIQCTRFSAVTVFSHKSSNLPAYVIHIVQEKYLKNVLVRVV